MVALGTSQDHEQAARRRPTMRLVPTSTLEVDDFEVISRRCGSISGQSMVSLGGRRDSAAILAHRIKYLATKSAAVSSIATKTANSKCLHAEGLPYEFWLASDVGGDQRPGRINNSFHHYRFVVTMLGGMSVGLMLLLRFNITIAILQMVNTTHLYLEEHPNRTLDDFLAEGLEPSGEFEWNNEIVAIILAWYMFGYTLPGPLMAKLASLAGLRLAVPLLLATCALATLLTPAACYLGWQYVVACRLLNGLGASAIIPQLLSLIEKWMRYDELTAGLSVAYLLNATMAALTPLLCGLLADLHWSHAFYAPALFTLCFCALWLVLVTDEPHSNWLVSERELDHISECDRLESDLLRQQVAPGKGAGEGTGAGGGGGTGKGQVRIAVRNEPDPAEASGFSYTPDSWLEIFRVPSFYAYIALWCCYCSTYSGFVFILPAYMQQFLRIHVSENGFYCFLIQSGCILSVLWPHQMLKLVRGRPLQLGPSAARIVCYALCCLVGAFTWIYVGATHSNQLGMLFLNRAAHPGNDVLVTSCLMANFAKAGLSGHAFAVVNTLGNFSIVLSSTFIGWLLDRTGASEAGWCCIFTGLGATQLVMFVIFATCVSAEPIKFRTRRRRAGSERLEAGQAHEPPRGASAEEPELEFEFGSNETTRTVC